MKSKQIFFYGTNEEIFQIINKIEESKKVKFIRVGLLDEIAEEFTTFGKIEGFEAKSNWNLNQNFLVLPNEGNVEIREVAQRSGGVKYAIDQMNNQISFVISLGGEYSNEAVIASKIATLYESDFTKEFFKLLKSELNKGFEKHKGFFVGSQAMDLFKNGYRLTTNAKASPEYDLVPLVPR